MYVYDYTYDYTYMDLDGYISGYSAGPHGLRANHAAFSTPAFGAMVSPCGTTQFRE